jgi:ferredoxin
MASSSSHHVDAEACRGDGICVEVCPSGVFELVDKQARVVESRAKACIACGQCIAACPLDAIRLSDLSPELFEKRKKHSLEYEDFHSFLSARRSIRKFKDRPVDRGLIEKIVRSASTAPMGAPPHATEILVIDDPEELDHLRAATVKDYRASIRAVKNPLMRPLLRWQVGAELFHTIEHHVIPLAEAANEAFDEDGTDRYMYHAPVLMVFHANRWAPSYEESAHLVCCYAMLAAQTLGLGSTIIGKVPPIIDRSRHLRRRYGIPKDNKVITSLIVGYPKFRYRKSVRREFPSVRFVGGSSRAEETAPG